MSDDDEILSLPSRKRGNMSLHKSDEEEYHDDSRDGAVSSLSKHRFAVMGTANPPTSDQIFDALRPGDVITILKYVGRSAGAGKFLTIDSSGVQNSLVHVRMKNPLSIEEDINVALGISKFVRISKCVRKMVKINITDMQITILEKKMVQPGEVWYYDESTPKKVLNDPNYAAFTTPTVHTTPLVIPTVIPHNTKNNTKNPPVINPVKISSDTLQPWVLPNTAPFGRDPVVVQSSIIVPSLQPLQSQQTTQQPQQPTTNNGPNTSPHSKLLTQLYSLGSDIAKSLTDDPWSQKITEHMIVEFTPFVMNELMTNSTIHESAEKALMTDEQIREDTKKCLRTNQSFIDEAVQSLMADTNFRNLAQQRAPVAESVDVFNGIIKDRSPNTANALRQMVQKNISK